MLRVFLTGRGAYRDGKATTELRRGMAGIAPPEDTGFLMADPADPYAHYFCRFNGSYAAAMARTILKERGARFFAISNAPAVADCMRKMGAIFRGELPVAMGQHEVWLAQALMLLSEEPVLRRASPVISDAAFRDYLRDHLSDPTDLGRIADHFQISTSSLCRKVRQSCGSTVQALHEEMKIEWACTLLQSGSLNVTEVAQRVGYADSFYFSRVFKKHMTVSPKAFAMKFVE